MTVTLCWSEWQEIPDYPGFEWSRSFPAEAVKMRTLVVSGRYAEAYYLETPTLYCADSIEQEVAKFQEVMKNV